MKKIIVWTPINTSGHFPHLENDPGWMNRRAEIMNHFTIQSMRAQTCKDFDWWIEVREDTRDYWEDALNLDGVPARILSRAPVTDHKKGKNAAWERDPRHVEEWVKAPEFLEVRLNSDDLYRRTFIEALQKKEINPETQAILPRRGYYWFLQRRKLYKTVHKSPPFYALIYETERWLYGHRHPLPGGHMAARKLRNQDMNGHQWVWIVHDVNNKIVRKGPGAYNGRIGKRPTSLVRLKEFGFEQ
jgi:hypothetical protein